MSIDDDTIIILIYLCIYVRRLDLLPV